MHPQVLVRLAADFPLDGLVDEGGVGQVVARREVLQCRVEVNVIARFVVPAEVTERYHGTAAALGNAGGGGNTAGRNAEEGREYDALAAIVLVRGVPDRAIGLQTLEQAS